MNEGLCEGVSVQTTLNISCTIKNLSGKAISGVLTSITQLDGIASVSPNTCQFIQSALNTEDVMRAENAPSSHKLLDSGELRNKNELIGGVSKHLVRRLPHMKSGGDAIGGKHKEESRGGNNIASASSLPKFMR